MRRLVLTLALAGCPALANLPAPEPEAPRATEDASVPVGANAPAVAAQHPQGIEKAMGVIEGGWEYVYAAYGAAFLGVAGFALSLFARRPKGKPAS